MQRYHQEISITRRNWAEHRRNHVRDNVSFRKIVGKSAYAVDCICDEQKGRFRKTDAYDCGKARCKICHGEKYPVRELTIQEINSLIKFKEQVKEM